MTGFSGDLVGIGHRPNVTRNIRRVCSTRCFHSSGDLAGTNEKSPLSPLNGFRRVSAGISPGGRTRGGLAIVSDSSGLRHSVAMMKTTIHPVVTTRCDASRREPLLGRQGRRANLLSMFGIVKTYTCYRSRDVNWNLLLHHFNPAPKYNTWKCFLVRDILNQYEHILLRSVFMLSRIE